MILQILYLFPTQKIKCKTADKIQLDLFYFNSTNELIINIRCSITTTQLTLLADTYIDGNQNK